MWRSYRARTLISNHSSLIVFKKGAPGSVRPSSALGEDYGFVGVGENAVIEVPADGTREDEALQIAALLDEVGELVVLGDASDVLFDDGAFIENFCDVVAGGSDQLDSAGEGGVVGSGSGEGRKK